MGRKKEISDEALLEVARTVFIEQGHTVATATIAKAAGTSQATLFNRFESKRRLMILALAPRLETSQVLPSGPDQRSIPLQLVDLGHTLYRNMQKNEPAIRVLRAAGVTFEEVVDVVDLSSPMIMMNAISGWFQGAQEQGLIADGIPSATFAMVFGGAIKNLAMDEFFARVRSDPQAVTHYLTQLVDMLWRGLQRQSQH